jgi:DNA-3-methyladenine glycosylase II
MGLTAPQLRKGLDALAVVEPAVSRKLEEIGYPPPRERDKGYATLLRTIVGQQVSVKAADAVWHRLDQAIGDAGDPEAIITASDECLRGAGLSRQKNGYARSLASLILAGTLDLEALPGDDDEAIAALISVKGIGRWSAEVYLLFAEGRKDIWPAGDWLGWKDRPSEKKIREVAERWSPHRGSAAIFAWHSYNTKVL